MVANLVNRIKEALLLCIASGADAFGYARHSSTFFKSSIYYQRSRMMELQHAIEKGMCFATPRNAFGREKATELVQLVSRYIEEHGIDHYSMTAVAVLTCFCRHPYAADVPDVRRTLDVIIRRQGLPEQGMVPAGVKLIDPMQFGFNPRDVWACAETRCSVREYASGEISSEEVEKAVHFAQTSPSSCNRQTCRVHAYNKEKYDQILACQLGDQGWVNGADRLFVITSIMDCFRGTIERHQTLVDGGMFAMQFLLGLHAQRIACCCKMYVRSPKVHGLFHKVSEIPKNETPIMLIAAGHYKQGRTAVPASCRIPASEVIAYHY